MWRQSPFSRAKDLMFLSEETAEKYVTLLVESGSAEELRLAITRGADPIPLLIDRGELRNGTVANLARVFLRAKWSRLSPILGDPRRVRELVRANDPSKAALLDTPEGFAWLEWTLYRVKTYLGWFAGIKHMDRVQKPSGRCPLRTEIPVLGDGSEGPANP